LILNKKMNNKINTNYKKLIKQYREIMIIIEDIYLMESNFLNPSYLQHSRETRKKNKLLLLRSKTELLKICNCIMKQFKYENWDDIKDDFEKFDICYNYLSKYTEKLINKYHALGNNLLI